MAHPEPRLIAITDVAQYGVAATFDAFARLCRAAKPGSLCVQLRWQASAKEQLALGERLAALCATSEQHFSVNDRLDVALALGARAVHLKGGSVLGAVARRLWATRGSAVWLTRAWHPEDEALPTGIDALVVSPVSGARKGRTPLGVAGLRAAVERAGKLPVYALGGVDGGNVAPLVAAGARGVAAIGACYGDFMPLLRALDVTRGD